MQRPDEIQDIRHVKEKLFVRFIRLKYSYVPHMAGLNIKLSISILIAVLCNAVLRAQHPVISISANKKDVEVSKTLYGIFFEEINHAGEGGLYAEMVINRDFEYNTLPEGASWAGNLLRTKNGWHERKWFTNSLHGWSIVKMGQGQGSIKQVSDQPLNDRNPHSMRLICSHPGERMGVANNGFWGMNFIAGQTYDLSFYARTNANRKINLSVALESAIGHQTYSKTEFQDVGGNWEKYSCSFTPDTSDANGRLAFYLSNPDTVWFDVVSLFPRNTFKNRPNGLRPDAAQLLADLKPSFVRFPGGAIVGGLNLDNRIQWKNSIGDIAQRKGTMNLWGYWTSNGLGFHEYLQFCEDIGADALWVCNPGFSDNYRNSEAAKPEDVHLFVQEAMDALEYALGPVDSKWGALRAANGHPESFNLKYIEIGNEASGQIYADNYKLFYKAIKQKYPDLHIISNFDKVDGGLVEITDHHKYGSPDEFFNSSSQYDSFDRNGPRVYVGEYGVTSGVGDGNLTAALAEAAYLIGLERNADIVTMSSYAPLFYHINDIAWPVNMIAIDNARVAGRSSYYVQKLFAHNRPDYTLETSVPKPVDFKDQELWALAGFDIQAGEYIVKVVNRKPAALSVSLNFEGIKKLGKTAKVNTLWHTDPTAENSLDTPNEVVPQITEFPVKGVSIDYTLRPNSLTVIRIEALK
jgi:alpha-L-arabinofuranosidase